MIDQLRTMAIFQAVAETGSFRGAAGRLGLSPSVISHHVSSLEADLGLPLLYRSTRRISLTDAGRELLEASQKMSAAATEGLIAIQKRRNQPEGTLTITTNTASGHWPYSQFYASFSKAYPKVRLSMHISDTAVPLEGSEFDVAIRGRIDDLDDSSYRARKLTEIEICLFAHPDYVRSRPPLRTIDDLGDWDLIRSNRGSWMTGATQIDGTAPKTEPRTLMICDNYAMARAFVDEGLGFMAETRPLVERDFREGRLVELLPHLKFRPITVHAVYPANAPKDGLARLFVDHLTKNWPSLAGAAAG
ncbi:LysR family transcriptional regulator [Ponticoccus sp. SC2-23]|uniref:LysR family transcriptional regulator n=1 Tax=Alexandriicola marinus TaxID=2081710 RepID=UPI000FD9B197|nr:LysR family transcriptional regulator [Alexandriicola marinus]MBM1220288.1 LysR family transcriptional regulator [Ponticoccus sp. SC6-9]MBM1224974.1 LysR family transcriptional regulator [Ponticoccus sp. SC6-15]MBM1228488.1 LysR family transcriptional regulator [Ponticoccus sp. SC6-38]MBM1233875.1 LysR family transcriptional regulator [Ponticoccus sp. SC6-45]MBM1238989.1 LysR family transcriptional regulator [Ponticoccus sp. SC6-49]MBM1242771.1 LysR family transcriptional regulator [Pontic